MKKLVLLFGLFLGCTHTAFAALGRSVELNSALVEPENTKTISTQSSSGDGYFSGVSEFFANIGYYLIVTLFIVAGIIIFIKTIRLIFEIYYAKNIRYLKVTLPKADSKLDKERETKKDFKEKIGMMSMFYKAIHKLSEAGLRDTLLNLLFGHSKISLELVYKEGEVNFFITTYETYVDLVSQHITSIYTDAEVRPVDFKDYIDLKPK